MVILQHKDLKDVLQYSTRKRYCNFRTSLGITAILAVQTDAIRIFEIDSSEHNLGRSAAACSTLPQDQGANLLNKPDWCVQNMIKRKHVDLTR